MPKKTVILPISADSTDRKAHLRPILEFLFAKGNEPRFGVDEFIDEKVMWSYYLKKQIDWEELSLYFDFPDTIELHPDEGTIVDHGNALYIIEGASD